jgi:uncharacterized membrane protein YraQ (UPF0718 family)
MRLVVGGAGLLPLGPLGIPLASLFRLKQRSIGLGLSPAKAARVVFVIGSFLTYFLFIWRVALICAVEAIFLGILFTRITSNRWNPFEHPSWTPYWWYSVTAACVSLHLWAERRNLGKAALIVDR